MAEYVALLRGINVGGNNVIKMIDLKGCFAEQGLNHVATYIQSGNVLFEDAERSPDGLSARIEEALWERFGYQARIVLCTHDQMRTTVGSAPTDFGREPDRYRYDVFFLREPLTAAEAMQVVKTREGVDQAFAGDGVFYFSRLISRATQSYLNRIVSLPVFKSMTVRNWNTTTKLLALMDARVDGREGG